MTGQDRAGGSPQYGGPPQYGGSPQYSDGMPPDGPPPPQPEPPASMPPSPEQPARRAPERVREAWVFWLTAVALAVIGTVINALTTSLSDLPTEVRDQLEDAVARATPEGGDPPITVETALQTTMVVVVVLSLVLAGLMVWFAYRMRAGKLWARLVLDLGGVLLIVMAVMTLFDVFGGNASPAASSTPVWTFVSIGCTVLAGLCAGVAMWRGRSSEAMDYFEEDSRGRGH